MAQEWALWFYRSTAWLKCRAGYIASVFGLCERCHAPGLIVHHKEALTPQNIHDPAVSLNWEKLEYLCQPCHNVETFGSSEPVVSDGLMFDDYGNIVQMVRPP